MPLYIPFSQQQPDTWSGGQVHEIFRDPPEADYPNGDYRLWVGTATIERAADYSHFAQAERLHILLDGGGLNLRFGEPEDTIHLVAGGWHTFAGDRPLHVTPVHGPVFAFNLIYRLGQRSGARFIGAAEMPVILPVSVVNARLTQIIFGVRGKSCVESSQGHFLVRAGDTLVYPSAESAKASLRLISRSPDARLLLTHVLNTDQPTTSA